MTIRAREAPRAIIEGIVAGIPAGLRYDIENDREQAIHGAVRDASSRDVVIVAGKGHEDYQLYGDQRRAFSDQKVVRAALEIRAGGAA